MDKPRIRKRKAREIKQARRYTPHGCWDHLIVAPLWPLHGANLGTLLRTCDAAGACMAVPKLPWVPAAIEVSNTLRHRSCVHWVHDPVSWINVEREKGARILGVELADEAVRLADLKAAREKTIIILGHESNGIPAEAMELLDDCVEIPMVGHGMSLNVAVAGSLVVYKLSGLL